jgi:hypothetical protein
MPGDFPIATGALREHRSANGETAIPENGFSMRLKKVVNEKLRSGTTKKVAAPWPFLAGCQSKNRKRQ